MKRTIVLMICCMALFCVSAQELTVKSMAASPMDLSASQYRRIDLAGEACGLIKVRLAASNVGFEGNVIQPVEYKGGEFWVYMTKGSRELRIKHLATSPAFLPCHVSFADYDISGVEPLATYELTLLLGEKMQKLIIDYTPKDAIVLVDTKPYQKNGHLELLLTVGSHDYVIAKEGYTTIEGVAKLNKDNPRTIVETLKLENNVEDVQTQVNQQTHQVEIANKKEPSVPQTGFKSISEESERTEVSGEKQNDSVDLDKIRGFHEVKKRETILSITRNYDITVEQLFKANPEMRAPGYKLKKGTILNIPYPYSY